MLVFTQVSSMKMTFAGSNVPWLIPRRRAFVRLRGCISFNVTIMTGRARHIGQAATLAAGRQRGNAFSEYKYVLRWRYFL
jgi:hypothetical protein